MATELVVKEGLTLSYSVFALGLCTFIPFTLKLQNNFYRSIFSNTPFSGTWPIWMNGVTTFFYTISSIGTTRHLINYPKECENLFRMGIIGLFSSMVVIASAAFVAGSSIPPIQYFYVSLILESVFTIFYGICTPAAQGLVSELASITEDSNIRDYYDLGMFLAFCFTSGEYLLVTYIAPAFFQTCEGGTINFLVASILLYMNFPILSHIKKHASHKKSKKVISKDSRHHASKSFSLGHIFTSKSLFYIIGIMISGATFSVVSSMFFQTIQSTGNLGDLIIPIAYFVNSLGSIIGKMIGSRIASFGYDIFDGLVGNIFIGILFIGLFSLCNLPINDTVSSTTTIITTNVNIDQGIPLDYCKIDSFDNIHTDILMDNTTNTIVYRNAPRLIKSDFAYCIIVMLFGILNSLVYSLCYGNCTKGLYDSWHAPMGALMSTSNDVGTILGTFLSFGIQAMLCGCNPIFI